VVFEREDARMLEKSADDRSDCDGVADSRDPWPQTADTANDQIDSNARTGRAVEVADDAWIGEAIDLDDDVGRLTGAGVPRLAFEQRPKLSPQVEGCDHQFPILDLTRIARQVVEQFGEIGHEARVRREQTKIGVDLRRHRIVIAGADMRVAFNA